MLGKYTSVHLEAFFGCFFFLLGGGQRGYTSLHLKRDSHWTLVNEKTTRHTQLVSVHWPSLFLKQISSPTLLGIIWKLTDSALDPLLLILDKDTKIKSFKSNSKKAVRLTFLITILNPNLEHIGNLFTIDVFKETTIVRHIYTRTSKISYRHSQKSTQFIASWYRCFITFNYYQNISSIFV